MIGAPAEDPKATGLEAEARKAADLACAPEASGVAGAPNAAAAVPTAALVEVTGRCQGCGACLLTCPTHAIRPHGGLLLVRADLCTGCLECIDVCPVDAIDELPGGTP